LIKGATRIISNDPGVRLGEVEAVHQMRVGARRLRSDLQTFDPLVHAYWADDLVAELRWIAGLLGEVRDIDVFKENVEVTASDLHDDLKLLNQRLDERHAEARAELSEALSGGRYIALLDSVVAAARDPHLTDEAARPATEVLPALVAKAWKKLARQARDLSHDSSPEAFHKVRIKAKKVRYAAEAVGPALGKRSSDAKDFAARVEAVQEVLGDHQDALVAGETIGAVARDHPEDGSLNLASGRLIERELQKGERCRRAFFGVWGKLDRKKRRKWFET
jgi:CHAD domain-containing protein